MALAATVWLEAVGGSGLYELSRSCLARTEELKRRITAIGNPWRLAYPTSPTFNEFLLVGPGSGVDLVERMASDGLLAGVPTTDWGGSWPDGVLVAVTERNSVSDLDALVDALEKIS
jgi:glycine dehydrogenase subunit 1